MIDRVEKSQEIYEKLLKIHCSLDCIANLESSLVVSHKGKYTLTIDPAIPFLLHTTTWTYHLFPGVRSVEGAGWSSGGGGDDGIVLCLTHPDGGDNFHKSTYVLKPIDVEH